MQQFDFNSIWGVFSTCLVSSAFQWQDPFFWLHFYLSWGLVKGGNMGFKMDSVIDGP